MTPEALERIEVCRAMLEEKIAAHEIMYGTNTGIGEFSEVVLSDEQVQLFQRALVYNHAAGIGEPAAAWRWCAPPWRPHQRARPRQLGHQAGDHAGAGRHAERRRHAGRVHKGSVGACGDLAPMAQLALSLMGEGESFYRGERMATKLALERAGIEPPGLQARDGLGTINGSNVLTSMSALLVYDADRWLRQAEIACAMSLEALLANLKPYDTRLHELRGFAGAVRSAAAIRRCIAGSDLATGKIKTKVQDAYSMRSSPQVIGAAHDAVAWAASQVEIELNGVGDNPIFLPEDKLTLTGANFQGTPVSLPMELVGQAITMVSVLSERRLNRLENPALSQGLPDFLTAEPGFYSGLMLSQYTADTLITEQRILSAPAATMSIPAAADQEDFVSMGMNTALKNRQILENARAVVGIELMAAAQALDFREFTPGEGVQRGARGRAPACGPPGRGPAAVTPTTTPWPPWSPRARCSTRSRPPSARSRPDRRAAAAGACPTDGVLARRRAPV